MVFFIQPLEGKTSFGMLLAFIKCFYGTLDRFGPSV